MRKQFDVEGMHCAACSASIEKVVGAAKGVYFVSVNLLAKSMIADFDENVTDEKEIIKTVKAAGFKASVHDMDFEKEDRSEINKMTKRFFVSAVFLIILMLVATYDMIPFFSGEIASLFKNKPIVFMTAQIVLLLPIVIINRRYYSSGIKNLVKRNPNMDSLIALGSGASIIYGLYSFVMMLTSENAADYTNDLYFESAAMILTLITLGKMLEERAKARTGDAVRKLKRLSPDEATVIRNGSETVVKTKDITIGDIVVLKAGEAAACDGEVIEGSGAADESHLTGENMPRRKCEGDKIICASVLTDGYIKFRAEKTGEDTTLANIISMTESAEMTKPDMARIADKVCAVFVPTVIGIAVICAIVWMILGYGFEFALTKAVSVLVISCPCALGLATPVAVTVGLGRGAQNGVLIKSAKTIEAAGKKGVVIFDKTGTVTSGKPSVDEIVTFSDIKDDEALSIAAAIEKMSNHPLAYAIVKKAVDKNIALPDASEFESVSGMGVSAVIDGIRYFGGNEKFVSPHFDISAGKKAENGQTVLYFGKEGEHMFDLFLSDTIKEDSAEAIRKIKQSGYKTCMLTGDNAESAKAVSKKIGTDEFIAEALPGDKQNYVLKMKEKYGSVIMVGDGINDAPSLAVSDVGVAIGSGTDIAVSAADIVLVRSSLSDLAFSLRLSKKVIRNIKINLFWAFIYNIIGIPIAAGVFFIPFGIELSPMIASAAMSLSSVCVVLNALRIKFTKI